jgi:plasmid stability protein
MSHVARKSTTAQLVVRNLEPEVKTRLQRRAKKHGRSLEAEVRDILRDAVKKEEQPEEGLGTRIAKRFKGIGLRDDEEIREWRGFPVRPVEFEE